MTKPLPPVGTTGWNPWGRPDVPGMSPPPGAFPWRGMPPIVRTGAPIVTGVHPPTPAELEKMARKGVPVERVKVVAETSDGNGGTVTVAADENGNVVATEPKQNLAPLVMLAGLAWLLVN